MSILTKITKKNLLLNKKRAIGTIIGITLSVALICAVSGMLTSFRETLIKNSINATGYYHIALNGTNKDMIKKLNLNKDIKDIYYTYELGISKIVNDDGGTSHLTIYSLNKQNFDNLSYKIVDGTFPKNSNEILITENLSRETNLHPGDNITLDIITNQNENITKEYKITGTTYRRKNSTGNLIITGNTTSDNIWAYISLKKPKDYKNSFIQLLGAKNYQEIENNNIYGIDYNYVINNELLKWEVFAFSNDTIRMLVSVASIVICIIIITSVFCIRNSFAISTTEKMRMYGMLSSIGATKKQIKRSVIQEGMILSLIGIPLGILCGTLAVFILIKLVNLLLGSYLFNNIDGLIFKISLVPILLSILLGLITIYFSSISSQRRASRISPIDNLRNTQDINLTRKTLKTPKIINRIFKTGGTIAYKNLKRSQKKYRTTVISITVSIFVFISMYTFINIGFTQAGMYYQNYSYNISVDIPTYWQDETDEHINTSENTINKIRNLDNINASYLLYASLYNGIVLDKDKIIHYDDMTENHNDLSIIINAIDDNSFKEYTNRLGLKYDLVKDKGILINELYYYSNKKNKFIINDRYKYQKGDTINMEQFDNNQKKISITLADVTYERPIGLENEYYDGGYLIINKDYYQNLELYPLKLLIDTDDPFTICNTIEEIDNTISIQNIAEEVKIERAMVIVISIFLYGFIIVITLIGITNIFNTITSNMELRQKEFAMLKSIGMTKKEFNHMINLETFLYSVKSLVYGITLGLIGSYLIHLGFNEHTQRVFTLPTKAIIISIIFVFIIVSIIMKYSINKINKKNAIETIRNENI